MKNTDLITLDRIKKAHPKVRQELLNQYIEISGQLPDYCRLRFAYVYRSPEEQNELFKKRPRVTFASAWQSIHQYGLAFDIVLLYDNDRNGTFEEASWSLTKDINKDKTPEWKQVTDFFKSKGWEWGGDWKKPKTDAPHFQKDFGLTWQQMKSRIDSNKFVVENGIKYINL